MTDATNPDHYKQGGVECIDAIRAALGSDAFVAHCAATAIKYAWRFKHKGSAEEDLRKGAWYLARAADELANEAGALDHCRAAGKVGV